MLQVVLCLCFLGIHAAHREDQPIADLLVYTNYGYVLGSIGYSRDSREYSSFRGIPFAQPPVGDLRFQNPIPPEPWNSPYNATVDGPICLQLASTSTSDDVEFLGQEDCLYLNIYVPTIEGGSTGLLPVMVFIPGGAFVRGGAPSYMYGPQYFMDRDVILVTLNYRLGPLGFLSTLDDEAPGNFGFKDQVMALRFVNENIEYFGGDKERVTLFGESAGSASVGIQLLSPLSDGLFQQAIGQSGDSWAVWALDNNQQQLFTTSTLAVFVECYDFLGDNGNLIQCLRNLDAETIVATLNQFQIFFGTANSPFRTVTETKTERNPEPFLEKSALDYVKAGEFKKIPYIIGNNQDEGILLAAPILQVQELQDEFNANFDGQISAMLYLQEGYQGDILGLIQNLTDFYLGGDHFVDVSNPNRIQSFIDMVTDRLFLYSTDQVILAQYSAGQDSIWVYNFDYRGNYSQADTSGPSNVNFDWGVSHADDLQFFFYSPEYLAPAGLDGVDAQVSKEFVTIWTNFATFGNPDPYEYYLWYKLNFDSGVSNENLNFLNISGSFADGYVEYDPQVGYNLERMAFWTRQDIRENS